MVKTLKIKIPSSWKDITVKQYEEIIKYNIKLSSFNTVNIGLQIGNINSFSLLGVNSEEFDNLLFTLSVICDIDLSVIEQLDVEQLQMITNKLTWIGPIRTNKKGGVAFNKLTTGQWIDLEMVIKNGLEDNLSYFFQKLVGEDVGNESITEYYHLINEFIEYRKDLYERFKGLFESNEGEDEQETIKSSEQLYKDKFNDKWNWYQYLFRLANEDVLQMDKASELNFIASLNHYSFVLEKSFLK